MFYGLNIKFIYLCVGKQILSVCKRNASCFDAFYWNFIMLSQRSKQNIKRLRFYETEVSLLHFYKYKIQKYKKKAL